MARRAPTVYDASSRGQCNEKPGLDCNTSTSNGAHRGQYQQSPPHGVSALHHAVLCCALARRCAHESPQSTSVTRKRGLRWPFIGVDGDPVSSSMGLRWCSLMGLGTSYGRLYVWSMCSVSLRRLTSMQVRAGASERPKSMISLPGGLSEDNYAEHFALGLTGKPALDGRPKPSDSLWARHHGFPYQLRRQRHSHVRAASRCRPKRRRILVL